MPGKKTEKTPNSTKKKPTNNTPRAEPITKRERVISQFNVGEVDFLENNRKRPALLRIAKHQGKVIQNGGVTNVVSIFVE